MQVASPLLSVDDAAMQPRVFPPLVEAFLILEQPRQRLSHWTTTLAALDDERAPPLATVTAYFDPTCDQAVLGLRYDQQALRGEGLGFVIEIALLAEIGMIQPSELSESERQRFVGERLARCTMNVTDQRNVVNALTELVRRVRERQRIGSDQQPPIPRGSRPPPIPLPRRAPTEDPALHVQPRSTRDDLGLDDPARKERSTREVTEETAQSPARVRAESDHGITEPMPVVARRNGEPPAAPVVARGSRTLSPHVIPRAGSPRLRPPPEPRRPPSEPPDDAALPDEAAPRAESIHRKATIQMDPLDSQKLAASALPEQSPLLREKTRVTAAEPVPVTAAPTQPTPAPKLPLPLPPPDPPPPRLPSRRAGSPDAFALDAYEPALSLLRPGTIFARYLRSGRWVPIRIGALSLRGAALMAGALPRLGDHVDIALAYADHRALVRGPVHKVSSQEEAAQSGAASFSVTFELDDRSRRDLTALLTSARAANVTIKPPPARCYRRYPVEWPVCLGTTRGAIRAEALDVSIGGMFVRPGNALALDASLGFSAVLDDGSGPVSGRSRVVRHIDEADARNSGLSQGYGLQIVEMGDADRERWGGFLLRIEKRAEKRVLIGAAPGRLLELQAGLAAAGYSVTGATDPDALVLLASQEMQADACLIDAGWLPPSPSGTWAEVLFPTRSVPCVAMRGDVRRARAAIDRVLSIS